MDAKKIAVVYTSPSCQPCKMLKAWLKENNLEYIDKDLEENLEEAVEKGVRSVPSTIFPDGTLVVGFNKEKLMKELSL